MPQFLASLGAIVLVDIALSGDNALVIGAAAAALDRRRRWWAIFAGGAAAVVLRIVFAALATVLLALPLLEAAGGIVLIIIAGRLLASREAERHAAERGTGSAPEERKAPQTFAGALLTIMLADLTMSLDNILAVGGLAHGNLPLLIVGVLLSVTLLLIGSAIIAELIGRLPWLLDVAALVLGWTAGTMMAHDHIVGAYLRPIPFTSIVIPAIGAAIVLLIDLALRSWGRRPRGRPVAERDREQVGPMQ